MDLNFVADKIAKLCFDFYEKNLLTKSKPATNEWTNLASIVCCQGLLCQKTCCSRSLNKIIYIMI